MIDISDFIIDVISGILSGFGFTSKSKLEKNIDKLKGEEWFSSLYKDYRFNHIIWHNRRVKRFLSKSENVKLLTYNEQEREKFFNLVKQEHSKFVGLN